MLTDGRFWMGVIVGFILVWAYHKWGAGMGNKQG